MRIYMRLRIIFILTIIIALQYGCQEDVSDINGSIYKNEKVDAYLTISINTSSSSNLLRSNPTGGEDGDGTEIGTTNENSINDLTVVFYKVGASTTTISSCLDNVIDDVIYVSSADISSNKTTSQRVSLSKSLYRTIVIANAGDLTSSLTGKTVRQVANYLVKNAWTAGSPLSNFVMTSVFDDIIDLSISTTILSPAYVEVSLERLAARVDILPSKTTGESINNYLISTDAKVEIKKVKIINSLTAGSYLVKRVATNIDGTPSLQYYGVETPASGTQTNYTIDPWSSLKTKTNLTGTPFSIDGVSSAASSLYSNYYNSSFSIAAPDAINSIDYILGYTLENTIDKDQQLNGYTTGVMFETNYIPLSVTNYNTTTRINETKVNSALISFFTLSSGTTIFNSLESITYSYLKIVQPANDFFAQVFNTSNTWQQLQDYSDRIHDNDPLGFRSYILNLLIGKTLTSNITSTISWSNFVYDNYGYSNTAGTVTIDQNLKNTTNLLAARGLRCYADGKCYYPYWIRHSNDNISDAGIMEFGIVRNNIYKLKVISFSGLGKPLPFLPGTDDPTNPVEESNINLFISVKPWKLIEHPVIVL